MHSLKPHEGKIENFSSDRAPVIPNPDDGTSITERRPAPEVRHALS